MQSMVGDAIIKLGVQVGGEMKKGKQTLGHVKHDKKERAEGEKAGKDDDDGLQAHVVLAVDHGRKDPQRNE